MHHIDWLIAGRPVQRRSFKCFKQCYVDCIHLESVSQTNEENVTFNGCRARVLWRGGTWWTWNADL